MAEHDSICLEAEISSLTADLDAINETRIAELECSMSKVQCSVQDINAKLDMLVNSALALQQSRKDDNLVRASDSQPVRPSGDHLARSGHNLTEQAGNGFIPDNKAMELDCLLVLLALLATTLRALTPDELDAMQLIAFEGDEETSPGVSPSLANYVSQCTRKRIDRDHLSTTLRQQCLRPENCESLVVPKVNPGIWKELDKGHRTKDVHLQSTQELLGRGLNAVVMAKDKLLNSQTQPERGTDDAHSEVNTLLSTAIAVLGNAFLDMPQRQREIM